MDQPFAGLKRDEGNLSEKFMRKVIPSLLRTRSTYKDAVGVLASRSTPVGVNQLTTNVEYSEDEQTMKHPQVGLHQILLCNNRFTNTRVVIRYICS